MGITVIKNARVLQTQSPFEVLEGVDIVIKDSLIKAVGVGAGNGIKADKTINATSKTVMPGFVCAHHHYYSGLSRGMLISAGPQTDFIQVLKEWWWRLDRGLDEEACYYSSLICSLDAIKAGTTSCIDHHASPSFINGSLTSIAAGMEKIGIRGTTCYEVTDRNGGMDEVRQGVKENIRFAQERDRIEKSGGNNLVQAMIGGHAPFTIPEEGLALMAQACAETSKGMHLHVAEAKYDCVRSHHVYNEDIVDRLNRHGLLSDKTLLVHGLFLNDHELEILNDKGCFLAHNARSNMNNHIGYCSNLGKVKNLVIGTDGCGGNMFEEIKMAFFKHKDEGGPWWPSDFVNALNRGNKLLEKSFKGSHFGKVEAGYKADLTIVDYCNPTPLVSDNAAGHIVWGMGSNCVETVIVDGNTVMENRQFNFDEKGIYAKAAVVAKRVWEKVDKIKA